MPCGSDWSPPSLEGHVTEPLRVLVVEQDRNDAELCLLALKEAGFEVRGDVVGFPEDFATRIQTCVYDVILFDDHLPGWTGLDALRLLRALGSNTPLILVAGRLSEGRAEDLARLPAAVRRALQRTRAEGGPTAG
jgi:two-component system, NarL family, sensor histidine kinase UhpB